MNKLVSFQILEARNVICIYNGAGRDVFSEVQCDDADDPFISIEIMSEESEDDISKGCKEFDRIYKKISE